MARPFCCAKASDTTSLRPVAPTRAVSPGLTKGRPAASDACNKKPTVVYSCNAAIPYALPPRIAADPTSVELRCTKNISSILPPRIAAINQSHSAARRAKPFIAAH